VNEDVRRRWRALSPEQLAIAEELLERADALREQFEDMSLAEAMELAVGVVERRRMRAVPVGTTDAPISSDQHPEEP
jgi:hypothetical protein